MQVESKWLLTDEEKDSFIAMLTPNLTVLRTKAEISQEELANLIGVSRQIYNSYENDPSKCELDLIFKILNSLEVTDQEFDDFLNGLKQDYLSYLKEKEE